MVEMTMAGKWVSPRMYADGRVVNDFGWSETPASVIAIVCDADHWTKIRAKGGTLREHQFPVSVEELL